MLDHGFADGSGTRLADHEVRDLHVERHFVRKADYVKWSGYFAETVRELFVLAADEDELRSGMADILRDLEHDFGALSTEEHKAGGLRRIQADFPEFRAAIHV